MTLPLRGVRFHSQQASVTDWTPPCFLSQTLGHTSRHRYTNRTFASSYHACTHSESQRCAKQRCRQESRRRQVAGSPSKEAYVALQSGAAAPRALTINSRDRQCLAPQTNRPRQSTVIEWLPYHRMGRIRVQTPDTWWHTNHCKSTLYRELG